MRPHAYHTRAILITKTQWSQAILRHGSEPLGACAGVSGLSPPPPPYRTERTCRYSAPRLATEQELRSRLSAVVEKEQSLPSEPVVMQREADASSVNRTPLPHLDPDLLGLVRWVSAETDHHALELSGLLPLLQLHRPQPGAYELVQQAERPARCASARRCRRGGSGNAPRPNSAVKCINRCRMQEPIGRQWFPSARRCRFCALGVCAAEN